MTSAWDKTGQKITRSLSGDCLNSHEKRIGKKGREENSNEWKERGKARGGGKRKETLITETLTHKKGEADTSGNQRNVSQLGKHPSIQSFLLYLYLKLWVNWGGGVVKEKKISETETKLKDALKPAVLKPCGHGIWFRSNQAAHLWVLAKSNFASQLSSQPFTLRRDTALIPSAEGCLITWLVSWFDDLATVSDGLPPSLHSSLSMA